MKLRIWCGLLLALLAGHAWAADPNTPASAITQATGASTGNGASGPLYPAQPVGSANPLYVRSSTLALDASIQQVVTILNAPLTINLPTGIATAANQATGNAFLSTLATFSASASTSALQATGNASLATIATNSGTQATAANQATGNASLASIVTNTAGLATASNQSSAQTSLTSIATNTALHSGTMTQTSVTCGTGSTTFLAASTATQFVSAKVPGSAANVVWFNWAGAAAVTAPPSEDVPIGGKATWTAGTNGFLPTTQINCIAASATVVTLEYK